MGMLMFSVLLSTNVLTVWGMLTRYGIVAYPSDIQYYIIEGGIKGWPFPEMLESSKTEAEE